MGFFNEDFWRGVVGNLIIGIVLVSLMSTTSIFIYRQILAGVRTRSETIKFGFGIGALLFLAIIALRLATLQTTPISSNDEKISTTLKEIQGEVETLRNTMQSVLVMYGPPSPIRKRRRFMPDCPR